MRVELKFYLIVFILLALMILVPVLRARYALATCASLCPGQEPKISLGIPLICDCRGLGRPRN